MYNWNTDITRLKKDTEQYEKFMLEQQINFGLNNNKLSLKKLKKHWNQLHIDTAKKSYLEDIIWIQS
ncbi:MAG: hypothetical protein GW942_00470 [Candidatus Pacebacteria bacterium]|nr:hypothetical protein [Candidatus Paceibacterota bacterium]